MGTNQAPAKPHRPSPGSPASRQWPAVQAAKEPARAKVLPGIAPSARAMPRPTPSGTRANSAGAPGTGMAILANADLSSPPGAGSGDDAPVGPPAGRGAHLAATPTRRHVPRSASSGPASTKGAREGALRSAIRRSFGRG